MQKIEFLLSEIPAIKHLLQADLGFLTYSTQKRNLCHLLELENLFDQIDKKKIVVGSLDVMCSYNLLRIRSDVIENLLFCAISTKHKEKLIMGRVDFEWCINYAHKEGLINSDIKQRLKQVQKYRNDFHPQRQHNLFVQIPNEVLVSLDSIVKDVIQELRRTLPDIHGRVPPGQVCPCCREAI